METISDLNRLNGINGIPRLPEPSKSHATCAWCRKDFDTVVQLLDHVDNGHIDSSPAAPFSRLPQVA